MAQYSPWLDRMAQPNLQARDNFEELDMVKKAPNPIDRYVGSRVRMRRLMLGMSQEKLGDGLGLTFQQVQKYEKGTNRIGASRLQHIAHLLQVPVSYFFDGAPNASEQPLASAPSPAYVFDFLATSEGLALIKAFMHIHNAHMRRRIVELVEEIAGTDEREELVDKAAAQLSPHLDPADGHCNKP
jgi:transcriptional regulator with XRE-family HTH domain